MCIVIFKASDLTFHVEKEVKREDFFTFVDSLISAYGYDVIIGKENGIITATIYDDYIE